MKILDVEISIGRLIFGQILVKKYRHFCETKRKYIYAYKTRFQLKHFFVRNSITSEIYARNALSAVNVSRSCLLHVIDGIYTVFRTTLPCH